MSGLNGGSTFRHHRFVRTAGDIKENGSGGGVEAAALVFSDLLLELSPGKCFGSGNILNPWNVHLSPFSCPSANEPD